jgi:hypothetical protein
MLAPATFLVTLGLIAAVVIGLMILFRAFGGKSTRQDLALGTQTRCPQCREPNPTHAKFCSKCGKPMS